MRIVPIDDVELISENILNSNTTTRGPKALRMSTQMPFVQVDMDEEMTTMRTKRPRMKTEITTERSIPQFLPEFNPLSPDLINSMFIEDLTETTPSIDVSFTTLRPVKNTEFLIRLPMDMPSKKSQKLVNSIVGMMHPKPLPKLQEFMRPPMISDTMQTPNQQEMFSNFMETTTTADQMAPNESMQNSTADQNQPVMNIPPDFMPNGNDQFENSQQNSQIPSDPQGQQSVENSPFQQIGNVKFQQDFQIPSSDPQTFQQLQNFPLQNSNFQVFKSVEVPQSSFNFQFPVENTIAVSDFNPFWPHSAHEQVPTSFSNQFASSRFGRGANKRFGYSGTYIH